MKEEGFSTRLARVLVEGGISSKEELNEKAKDHNFFDWLQNIGGFGRETMNELKAQLAMLKDY